MACDLLLKKTWGAGLRLNSLNRTSFKPKPCFLYLVQPKLIVSGRLGLDVQASEPGAGSDIGLEILGTVYIKHAWENSNMASIWRKFKVGLLIGMLYAVYYLIRSSRALKRLQIPRISWGIKS